MGQQRENTAKLSPNGTGCTAKPSAEAVTGAGTGAGTPREQAGGRQLAATCS